MTGVQLNSESVKKARLNEMRKDFFNFLKLPPSPEGVIKSPL